MKWPPLSRASRTDSVAMSPASRTRWQRPPWNSIAAIFSGDVEAGITATNGSPSRRAKYASDTAVEPLEASTTVLPACSQPLASAYRNSERRSEEHTSELQSREKLVCRLLLEKKNPAEIAFD